MKKEVVSILLLVFVFLGCNRNTSDSFNDDLEITYKSFFDSTSGLYGIKNINDEIVVPPKFEFLGSSSEGLIAFRDNSYWGYINEVGNIVIEPKFDWVEDFSGDYAPVVYGSDFVPDFDEIDSICHRNDDDCILNIYRRQMENSFYGHWGYIFKNGSIIIEPEFDKANKFSEDLAAVKKDGLWGFIDIYGNYQIEPKFLDARDFSEGLAPVKDATSNNWGYINKEGGWIIWAKFSEARIFSQGLAAVKDYSWGYIDKSGDYIIPPNPKFERVEEFDEQGYATVWVECTAENESCVWNEWTYYPSIINKEDYIKEDNFFVSIVRKTIGEKYGDNLKSFLFEISKNKTQSFIAKVIVFIFTSILWIAVFVIVIVPFTNLFPNFFSEKNSNSDYKQYIKDGFYIGLFLSYIFLIGKCFELFLYK